MVAPMWEYGRVAIHDPTPIGTAEVGKIIASVAKQVLAPLGVRRKGRSRTWLDDHGWWLGIVEFQPSNWGAGSYLNVGLMFLWQPVDHLAFEVGYRLDEFSPADDEASFQRAIHAKAEKAKDELMSLRRRFASPSDVTTHYATSSKKVSMNDQANLGTAWGLLGDMKRCRSAFDQALVLREQAYSGGWRANAWMLEARQAAADQCSFQEWASSTLNQTRASLNLAGPIEVPLGKLPRS